MEEELGSGKARPNPVNLGGGDSDGEGVEEDDDDLEMTKYDEGEVAVNEEDELAVSFRVHWEEVMSKFLNNNFVHPSVLVLDLICERSECL